MPQDIMSLVIHKNKVIYMEGMTVDFVIILSFDAIFGRFDGLQCNMIVFSGVLKHVELLF